MALTLIALRSIEPLSTLLVGRSTYYVLQACQHRQYRGPSGLASHNTLLWNLVSNMTTPGPTFLDADLAAFTEWVHRLIFNRGLSDSLKMQGQTLCHRLRQLTTHVDCSSATGDALRSRCEWITVLLAFIHCRDPGDAERLITLAQSSDASFGLIAHMIIDTCRVFFAIGEHELAARVLPDIIPSCENLGLAYQGIILMALEAVLRSHDVLALCCRDDLLKLLPMTDGVHDLRLRALIRQPILDQLGSV